MDAQGSRGLRRGASRITAVIAIEGPEDRVLVEGGLLLRTVVDDLDRAALLNLRLEYDQSAPPRIAAPETDVVDLVAPGSASPAEADLWRLALRAGAPVDGEDGVPFLLPLPRG